MWPVGTTETIPEVSFLLTHPVWDVTAQPLQWIPHRLNFYSHIPCGMWRYSCGKSKTIVWFLLTHPVWDVTVICSVGYTGNSNFYSHIPCGMWHFLFFCLLQTRQISTHTSRVGCDLKAKPEFLIEGISTHTSRVGCDEAQTAFYSRIYEFLLTHPVWDVT